MTEQNSQLFPENSEDYAKVNNSGPCYKSSPQVNSILHFTLYCNPVLFPQIIILPLNQKDITWLTTVLAAVFWSSSHPPSCNLFISSASFLALRISFCSIMVHKCSVSSSLRSSLSNRSSLASRNSFSASLYRFLWHRKSKRGYL
jgi:hypothetical protein